MQNDLSHLKNLGTTTIQWLYTIGVRNGEDLSAMGAVEAYHKIKQQGLAASRVTLYALHGALSGTLWDEIDPKVRNSLVAKAKTLSQTEPSR